MVHEKVHGTSNKSPSGSRRSAWFRARARANPTTIYTLNLLQQAQLANRISNPSTQGSSPFLHSTCESDGANREDNISVRSRGEKSILDKVEDMDIDHHSDREENAFSSEHPGTSAGVGLQMDFPDSKEKVDGRLKKEDKEIKEVLKGTKQENKKEKLQLSSKTKKTPLHEVGSGSKAVKRKPVYFILHAAVVRVGGITGKALSPVRIQAERILLQIEIKLDSSSEVLPLRIPYKELVAVQANLSEQPYLLVVFINHDYSENLLNGSKKNGVLSKIKGIDELEIVIQLAYDSIPKDVQQDLDRLRKDLPTDVRWKEISNAQAEKILTNKESNDSNDATDKEKKSLSPKQRKILKATGNRKKGGCNENEDKANKRTRQPTTAANNEEESQSAEPLEKIAKTESYDNCVNFSSDSPQKVVNPRLKRSYDVTADEETERNPTVLEEKAEIEPEKEETLQRTTPQHLNAIASEKESNESGCNERVVDKRYSRCREQSFEEDRLNTRRFAELEAIIVEKEAMMNQRRISLELRELQLEQERNTVQELRGSLRKEQTTRRDLETRFEAVNGELLERNARDMSTVSRMQGMERELSQLNITLGNVGAENQRLVQEIAEFCRRVADSEDNVRSERSTIATLQQDLEEKRTTLERLREELREKDEELRREQNLRAEAVERTNQMERTFVSTTEQYEESLRRSTEERTRLDREYDECIRALATSREEVQSVNSALGRAQETIEEYSRMQPRDWTIPRDEIEISEKLLGRGGWGWVKEGTFRGTKVAVKQMHELIVSPHNRRLFEREMQMAARCRHPCLLQFIGATNDNGLALLVTELLDTNLRAVLGQRSLCHEEVLTLSLDVSRALNYLHLNKPFPIIHRDISSTNVLLWKRQDAWHAKLSDYGAVNFMRQCMTVNPGASVYAAPEVKTSRQSTKVDVYSFGLLLCEMCIRELPVPQHTNDQIRLITNGHLRDLVQRCTHEVAEDRPTIYDVLSALQHFCSSTTVGMASINGRHTVF